MEQKQDGRASSRCFDFKSHTTEAVSELAATALARFLCHDAIKYSSPSATVRPNTAIVVHIVCQPRNNCVQPDDTSKGAMEAIVSMSPLKTLVPP